MKGPITSEIVVAYSLCPRKAFLLLSGERGTAPHEYVQITEAQAAANLAHYRKNLLAAESALGPSLPGDLEAGQKVVVCVVLNVDGLEARCDILRKVDGVSALGRYSYEPELVLGTHGPTRPQIIELAYLGYVLGQVQNCLPAMGTLVCAENRVKRVKLASTYKSIRAIVGTLKTWISQPPKEPPQVALNKHCPCCPFRDACREKAEKEDHLSLLDRMTPQLMKKYHGKGIFTITQLSYLYKPRRSKKRRVVRHRLELQALAIRTGKTYIEHLPELSRPQVELFVDVEGIPDQKLQYLIGLLVCDGSESRYYPFWADTAQEEDAWRRFIAQVQTFPSAPIHHYGDYERKAFKELARKYGVGREEILARQVNVSQWVYGRVYFPVRSNGLKEVGRFLGATWRSPDASGLQSLVWRHQWEEKHEERYKKILLEYNEDDCRALKILFDKLVMVKETGDTESAADYSHRPQKQATEKGTEIHQQFDRVLKSAHDGYERNKIRLHAVEEEEATVTKSKGAPKGHQAFRRIVPPKVGRVIQVRPKRKCPRHHCALVPDSENLAEKTVIDLVFTKNGCRKTITKYVGQKGYCPRCTSPHNPPFLSSSQSHMFGHSFQAWIVYQRIILRLPYDIITQVTEHLFGVGFSRATAINFLRYLADYYQPTEQTALRAMLESRFIHVDETPINVQGENNYVWVFTDGKHVVFRLTETREADIVHTLLAGYSGVLVSDFYPGYDSAPCRQQKCLVHLIRDLNEDLWDSPYDLEYEAFALEVRNLFVPIIETVDRYGLKTWHLHKYIKEVERFFDKHIVDRDYTSELAVKYQKRFLRYRDSLFTFLEQDNIPWNNNMAERAIRQLAVQRKISGTFFKQVAPQYLRLLAIAQTCRFQEKSFLEFLLSKSKDVDTLRCSKPIKYSKPVGRQTP